MLLSYLLCAISKFHCGKKCFVLSHSAFRDIFRINLVRVDPMGITCQRQHPSCICFEFDDTYSYSFCFSSLLLHYVLPFMYHYYRHEAWDNERPRLSGGLTFAIISYYVFPLGCPTICCHMVSCHKTSHQSKSPMRRSPFYLFLDMSSMSTLGIGSHGGAQGAGAQGALAGCRVCKAAAVCARRVIA